jgi:hypothetical protein
MEQASKVEANETTLPYPFYVGLWVELEFAPDNLSRRTTRPEGELGQKSNVQVKEKTSTIFVPDWNDTY